MDNGKKSYSLVLRFEWKGEKRLMSFPLERAPYTNQIYRFKNIESKMEEVLVRVVTIPISEAGTDYMFEALGVVESEQ